MKSIVVYRSKTGFTKKYAEWIAEAIDCDIRPMGKISNKELANYDLIIYGSGLMGGMIMGLDKIRNISKKLVVFATGASLNSLELKERMRKQNKLEDLPLFYMQGGLDFAHIGFIKRKMLGMVQKSLAKKTDKTEEDKYMEEAMKKSFDASNRKYIAPLVAYVKGLQKA